MLRRKRTIPLLVLGVILLTCAGVLQWYFWPWPFFGETYNVQRINIDGNRTIQISAAVFWEISIPVYYEVQINGDPTEHYSLLGVTFDSPRSLDFELLETQDHDLVAIVERSNPDVVLMIYEFSSKTNWPANGDPPWDEYYLRMNRMLDRLRAEYPARALILSHEIGGSRTLKIQG